VLCQEGAVRNGESLPPELKYSEDNLWVRLEPEGKARLGLTHLVGARGGQFNYVELPTLGRELKAGDVFGSAEMSKTAIDLISPLSGKIIDVNFELDPAPELMNDDPYGKGWILVLQLSHPEELANLLSREQFAQMTEM